METIDLISKDFLTPIKLKVQDDLISESNGNSSNIKILNKADFSVKRVASDYSNSKAINNKNLSETAPKDYR